MSIQLTNNDKMTATNTNSLYETRTLMCKNNCGYYGNSIQYEGYCSICYRKLKTNKHHQQQQQQYLSSSPSVSSLYDDSSSLLTSSSLHNSHSFSNHYSLDEIQNKNG